MSSDSGCHLAMSSECYFQEISPGSACPRLGQSFLIPCEVSAVSADEMICVGEG